MYQKEIIYLHQFDGEIRGGCVGYLKTEKKQERYYLELQVKNIPQRITGSFPIRLQSENGWQEADMLMIKDGNGKWTGTLEAQILRAEIILAEMRKIKGESRNIQSAIREEAEKTVIEEADVRETTKQITDKGPVSAEKSDPMEKTQQTEEPACEEKIITATEKPHIVKPVIRGECVAKTEHAAKAEHMPLYENKWEQLMSTYEQIHPYGDSRVYVKLAPKDFVILRENYQHLVNNSFLLHGFYNYRYLILGKESGFYLGVPGVFYEREKMVALMFGFEAFECEGGEAEEGKFGYYLRKVEL